MHTHVHGRERSARKEQVTHDLHFDEENGTSGRLENGRPRGPVLSHYTSQERQPAAAPELRTISLISHQAKSWWKSHWTDWRHKRKRSSLKNRQASEQDGVPQSRSTYESSVRNIFSTSKTSTMSSQTSRRPSPGCGLQLCGQPWSTTSAPTLSESSKTSMTRPLEPSSSTAA